MAYFIRKIFDYGPVLFGVGFLAPLAAEIMTRMELSVPGFSALQAGLVLGVSLGVISQWRGRWI